MAANGVGSHEAFLPSEVLQAVLTMRSSDAESKKKAAAYLESFQKSVRHFLRAHSSAWEACLILNHCHSSDKRLDHDHHHPQVRGRTRSQGVRRDNPQGQGKWDPTASARRPATFDRLTAHPQITYDLATQVPAAEHAAVRTQILELLKLYAPGPKPIRIQLCVCLAILAIQMLEWKDVLPLVVSSLGEQPESHACILDFLRVLPEEVTEGRRTNLSVCG